jgi:outer membrane lipoprotein-sorting protein
MEDFVRTICIVVTLFSTACLAAQDRATSRPADRAATQPAASQPSIQPAKLSSGDPRVDRILDRLEEKGQAIKGLGCKLTYKYVTVEPVEDAQVKEGELLFAVGEPNSKFLIHFTSMIAEGVAIERHEYFLFDGEWLIERNDKARTVIRRQIVRTGEKVDPFKLGKGPFPLPFGQKREDILRNFKVTAEKFEVGDPRNSEHLHCVPLPNTELATKYSRVEIYIDKDLELPTRIVTERLMDGNRIEVDFKGVDTKEAPAMSRFQVDVPAGFEVTEEPLPDLKEERPVKKGG